MLVSFAVAAMICLVAGTVIGGGTFGSSSFVCSRINCVLAIDVSKLETWVAE